MNIPEQGKLMCRGCGRREGMQPPAGAVWHYVTCARCRNKDAVTEQIKAPEPVLV